MPEAQNLLATQFAEVSQKYRNLKLKEGEDGSGLVTGNLYFSASYNNECLEDNFLIELKIPTDYPEQLPMVKETGGRIPQSFHHHDSGTLCLGVPSQVKMKFQENPTLLRFIDEAIIPYLYSFSYQDRYNKLPFDEFSHGGKGIIEYYSQLLKLESQIEILGFLRILVDDDYRGHQFCLCGSGERVRDCHGKQLKEIMMHQTPKEFASEFRHAALHLIILGTDIPKSYIPKSLKRKVSKVHKKSLSI